MRVSFSFLSGVLAALLFAAAPAKAEEAAAATGAAADAAADAAATLPAITVSTVSRRAVTERVIASGLVAPVEEVRVAPLIEGQPIEALLAEVGDEVEAGQVLAVLSTSTLELQRAQAVASLAAAKATIAQSEAQLLEAESAAAEAQRVADRTTRLRDQGSASQAAADTASANAVAAAARVSVARQALESARAQLALSEAQLANVELQLTRTEVRAPFAGRVVERNATVGAIATAAGAAMFVLERDGALELWADVAEIDLLKLAPGQKARLRGVGRDVPLEGTIRLVEPAIDTVTRMGRVRIAVEEEASLRAGMFLEAEIIVTEREALVVPVTALGAEGGQATVMRVTQGLVERVEVEDGIRDGGFVEIRSGLTEGDTVMTKAGSFVRAGDRVNPVAAATN
jgi:HlyD family secretion protein